MATNGTVTFAPGVTVQTFSVPIADDQLIEPSEMFTLQLSNLTGGAAFTTPSSATVTIADSAAPAANAIDDTDTFVRQQYHDFLNREPDAPGLAFVAGVVQRDARANAAYALPIADDWHRPEPAAAGIGCVRASAGRGSALDRPRKPGSNRCERRTSGLRSAVNVR